MAREEARSKAEVLVAQMTLEEKPAGLAWPMSRGSKVTAKP